MAEDHPDEPWLSLSEAAARTGRHIDALRAAVKRRTIPARKGNDGRWLVQLQGLPEAQAEHELGIAETALGGALGRAWAEVDRTRAEVEVLRAELGRTQEQATEGRIAAALLVELRAEAERLRAELAEARRPWWRRLIGS